MMERTTKLYWIDYTASGPMVGPWPFEIVGYETKTCVWELKSQNLLPDLLNEMFVNIESWMPDVLVIWFFGDNNLALPTDEPLELIQLCERIRRSPKLSNTKIMAFFRMKEVPPEKSSEWEARYDFYSLLPLKIVEHANVAQQLSGEKPNGIEGVLHYLSNHNSWQIFDPPVFGPNQVNIQLHAEGKFIDTPRTRLLSNAGDNYQWNKYGIKPNIPTKIAVLVKEPSKWKDGLSESEMDALRSLGNIDNSNSQLLLGVHSDFLELQPSEILHIINQASHSGRWQIFILEHLWLENHWLAFFDNLLYEKDHLEQRTLETLKIISP